MKNKSKKEGINYWLSYSDMMAALILVLILILSISMYKSKVEIESKQIEIENKEEEINSQEKQLNEMLGVKKEIIKSLQEEFKDSNLSIKIDNNTGSIVFDSDLLFDPDKYVLKDESKKFLDEFLPRYFSVLLGKKYADNVSEIIVEGHTAHYGSYMNCLDLSQKRAFAVTEYILRDGSNAVAKNSMGTLRSILTANGRAWCDPIYKSDGKTVDNTACRRVEIKFRLKDEEMIKQIIEMLDSDNK